LFACGNWQGNNEGLHLAVTTVPSRFLCVVRPTLGQSLSDRNNVLVILQIGIYIRRRRHAVRDQDRLLEISDSRGRAWQVVVRAVATGADSWHNNPDRPKPG